jgi:amino acid transporter
MAAGIEGDGRLASDEPAPGLAGGALNSLDSIVMAVAGSAPAYSIAATTTAIVAAVGLASPASLIYCGIPMMGIAIAYQFLNQTGAHAGAAYAWVGRILHPTLGFITGWALIVSALLFMVAGSLPAGQVTLSLFTSHSSTLAVTAVGAVWFMVMAYFVARGVRVTANAQWIMSSIEVLLLLVFAVLGIVHGHKALNFSMSWLGFSHFSSFTGASDGFVGGALIAAFYYWGWDVSSNLGEETEDSKKSAGMGGIIGVFIVFVLFLLFTVVINMDVPQKVILSGPANVLETLGQTVWHGAGGKLMVIAVMLSTIATLETTLIQVTRSLFAMGRDQTLPKVFGRIHGSWGTPVFATAVVAAVSLTLFIVSNFVGSVDKILVDAIDAIGLQIAIYYGLAGLAAVVAFRRNLFESVFNFVFMGVFPLGGAVFMFFIFGEAIPNQSLVVNAMGLGTLAVGVIPLIYYYMKGSPFLHERPTLGRTDVTTEIQQ